MPLFRGDNIRFYREISKLSQPVYLIWNLSGIIHLIKSYMELRIIRLIASIEYGLSAVMWSSHTKLCICEFTEKTVEASGKRSNCGIFFSWKT